MTQLELQQTYDAALVKGWRKHLQLRDVNDLFFEATGKYFNNTEGLLRTPPLGYPWKGMVRPFVAKFLEKISVRLWEQPIEKDEALLAKLATSKYTTSAQDTNPDRALANEKKQIKRNTLKVDFNVEAYRNRNSKTDWSTVK